MDAARRYVDSPISELRDIIRLDWDAMDAWFEEDEGAYTHPRDPYTRVDILTSSRRVRVELDGVILGESTGARVLLRPASHRASAATDNVCPVHNLAEPTVVIVALS